MFLRLVFSRFKEIHFVYYLNGAIVYIFGFSHSLIYDTVGILISVSAKNVTIVSFGCFYCLSLAGLSRWLNVVYVATTTTTTTT